MSAGLDVGQKHSDRESGHPMYMQSGDMGMNVGGTGTGHESERMMAMYENIFGPAGRDIKIDSQRHKRHQRWHLPDALKGHNQYLTDRIDGLITDATNSPFTRNILPYVYLEQPDQKLKWNVYSFDEGIASRVPYEAAARVLPQTKRSFAGYTVRQGLAIAMEHNFMVSEKGRQNFSNQLMQLVGSIQLTNDLDVHVALLQAPSYQKFLNEKYHDTRKTTAQLCREYVDLFGFLQKTPNALDILIEDAKNHLKTWGSPNPNFLLCNGALTAQLTMLPEKTNYLTNGADGQRRLQSGPELPSYRGLSIIHSRKFSMEAGAAPRDLLRRRVRVAEYYHIPWNENADRREYEFYDQSRDTMFRLSWKQLQDMASMHAPSAGDDGSGPSLNHTSWSQDSVSNSALRFFQGKQMMLDAGGCLHARTLKEKGFNVDNSGLLTNIHYKLKSSSGGLQFPGVIRRTGKGVPKLASVDDLTLNVGKVDKNNPLPMTLKGMELLDRDAKFTQDNLGRYEEFWRHDCESETFGSGIFNDHIVRDPKYAGDIKNWAVLDGACKYQTMSEKSKALVQGVLGCVAKMLLTPNTRSSESKCLSIPCLVLQNPTKTVIETHAEDWLTNRSTKDMLGAICDNLGPLGAFEAMTLETKKATIERARMQAMQMDTPARVAKVELTSEYVAKVFGITTSGWKVTAAKIEDDFTSIIDETKVTAVVADTTKGIEYIVRNIHIIFSGWLDAFLTQYFMRKLLTLGSGVNRKPDPTEKEIATMQGVCKHNEMYNDIISKCIQNGVCNGAVTNTFVDGDKKMKSDPLSSIDSSAGHLIGDTETVMAAHFSDPEIERITHNVMNALASFADVKGNCLPSLIQPNLHISSCRKLKADDEQYSASCMDPAKWVFQQAVSQVELCDDTVKSMLKRCSFSPTDVSKLTQLSHKFIAEDSDFFDSIDKQMYIQFLVNPGPDKLKQMYGSEDLWNSWIVIVFMSLFHPDSHVRERARQRSSCSEQLKRDICSCVAQSIDENKLSFCQRLKIALKRHIPSNFSEADVLVSTDKAAKKVSYVKSCMPARSGQALEDCQSECLVALCCPTSVGCAPISNAEGFQCVLSEYSDTSGNKLSGLTDAGRAKLEEVGSNAVMRFKSKCTKKKARFCLNPDKQQTAIANIHNGKDGNVCLALWDQKTSDYKDTVMVFPWVQYLPEEMGYYSQLYSNTPSPEGASDQNVQIYDADSHFLTSSAEDAVAQLRSSAYVDDYFRSFVLIMMARLFGDTSRFMFNGQGMGRDVSLCESKKYAAPSAPLYLTPCNEIKSGRKYFRNGKHLMHGPQTAKPVEHDPHGSMQSDIVILRPNIEHEMLGIIMGRGGTQELGSTFWGQTELSCYDDAQHGIWGMSYKYHERAMVTNERNLIRVFDVAFDGYNGGMDQKYVDWNDPQSVNTFRNKTVQRDRAYDGPSMLVMRLPSNPAVTRSNWPNPIVFHSNVAGNINPDPQKDYVLTDIDEHMVFKNSTTNKFTTPAQRAVYQQYMNTLAMNQWASHDQSARPAGEACVANESQSSLLAFQGTMRVYDERGGLLEHVQGSGHLGPSYVGVASIREGRGVQNAHEMPHMIRQI